MRINMIYIIYVYIYMYYYTPETQTYVVASTDGQTAARIWEVFVFILFVKLGHLYSVPQRTPKYLIP